LTDRKLDSAASVRGGQAGQAAERERAVQTHQHVVSTEQEDMLMKSLITCALAAGFAASLHAQDTTSTTRTQVDADDARTIIATGCLQQAPATKVFTLMGAVTASGEDLDSKTRVSTDVDNDDVEVKTETRAEIDRDDRPVGTSGVTRSYDLSPRAGVDLSTHVGKRVQISAVMVDRAKDGDDDAEVEIEDRTKVEREDAPDAKAKSETEVELPRGDRAQLMVVSVKEIAPSCAN
jgi:hypothetical protein